MDGLIVIIAIVFWALSAAAKRAKTAPKRTARQTHDDRPLRPIEVDLPGQQTMPIHWHGSDDTAESAPRVMPEPSPDMRAVYYGDRIVSAEQIAEEDFFAKPAPKVTGAQTLNLNLSFEADAMVKGVIYSEILNRKHPRRTR